MMRATSPEVPVGRDLMLERLQDVLLVRVATAKKPLGLTAIASALRAFAPSTFDEARWNAAVSSAHDALVVSGAIGADRRVAKPADLFHRLGIAASTSWTRYRDVLLPALALGLPAGDARTLARLAGRDGWAAATMGRALGLWTDGPPPRLGAVCDALVWSALGLGGHAKRTPPEIRAHFLHRTLPAGSGTVERRVHQLAAREAGAVRSDLSALRQALVRRWLCGQEWPAPRARSEDSFVAAVRAAADQATEGVFGTRKVFISSVWQRLRSQPDFRTLTLDDFKRELVNAHKAGNLTLARGDLSSAMDTAALTESEITHLEARYHFVERGGVS